MVINHSEKEEIAKRTAEIILSRIGVFVFWCVICWAVAANWQFILTILAFPAFWLLRFSQYSSLQFTEFPLLNMIIFVVIAFFIDLGIVGLIYAVWDERSKIIPEIKGAVMGLYEVFIETKKVTSKSIDQIFNYMWNRPKIVALGTVLLFICLTGLLLIARFAY
jgi:hypothetical protein